MFAMDLKFSVGNKVVVKGSKITGAVVERKFEYSESKTKELIVKKYWVKKDNGFLEWFNEDLLQDSLKLNNKKAVAEVLIDLNLQDGNYGMVQNVVDDFK